jgi:hypothetical protein
MGYDVLVKLMDELRINKPKLINPGTLSTDNKG